MATYPAFCLFVAGDVADDPLVAAVAAEYRLGRRRPGLILGEEAGMLRVLVAVDGGTALLTPAQIVPGAPEEVALGLMEAVEDAIEDAHESQQPQREHIARLEATLALLEQALADDEWSEM
jgi:hypothetical protein